MNRDFMRAACRSAGMTLVLTALVWTVFSWPLPRYAGRGIPMSSQNIEWHSARTMIPGDHLQLLYRFQLAGDFLSGRIPFFQNVYEFNTGNDAERYQPGAYSAPFSVVYALFSRALPPAGAWNLVGFLSLWATLAVTLAYVRRFTRVAAAAWIGALISILIPYRWVNVLGGSPTGFAMLWPPLIAWALDGVLRYGRIRDGLWGGIALLFACWSDLQTFFFVTLSLPLWAFISAWDANLLRRPFSWSALRSRIPAGLFVLAGLAAAGVYRWILHEQLTGSQMGSGRNLAEVLSFSPSAAGFWTWRAEGLQSHVYLGLTAALILAGLLYAVGRRRTSPPQTVPSRVLPALLIIVLVGAAALALGARGPFHGAALEIMRKLVPPYAMIRQTAKVFVLLPTLLALGAALAANSLWLRPEGRRRWPAWVLGAATLGALVEYGAQVRATVCLLDSRQGGYAAIAQDAQQRHLKNPRALVLPLWPGDSAETSIYQYYAQHYGLRIVNGYSPIVSRDYVENVFRPLQAANQGELNDSLLQKLRDMQVSYLVLHEDLFPEKVSPFPVSWTRDRLRAHPRLTLLAQDGAVWTFRIESKPQAHAPLRSVPVRYPARRIAFERLDGASPRIADDSGSKGAYRILRPGAAPLSAGPWRVAPDAELAWFVRVRGHGTLLLQDMLDGQKAGEHRVPVDSPDWIWIRSPIASLESYGPLRLDVQAEQGSVDADTGWLIAGDWNPALQPGETRELAPADFFHAGYSDLADQSVTFRPDRDPADAIFYGLRLPLEPGFYALEWTLESDAPPGTPLGQIAVRSDGSSQEEWTPVRAGEPARMVWTQGDNRSVSFVFSYSRAAEVRIQGLRLIRR